jgi:hypothetical protein
MLKQAKPQMELQSPHVPNILRRLINLLKQSKGVKDGMAE